MKKLLMPTVTLGVVVALTGPTFADASCPVVAALVAQQHAAVAEAEGMADQCNPAWLAAEKRALALIRQMIAVGTAAGCHQTNPRAEANILATIKRPQAI